MRRDTKSILNSIEEKVSKLPARSICTQAALRRCEHHQLRISGLGFDLLSYLRLYLLLQTEHLVFSHKMGGWSWDLTSNTDITSFTVDCSCMWSFIRVAGQCIEVEDVLYRFHAFPTRVLCIEKALVSSRDLKCLTKDLFWLTVGRCTVHQGRESTAAAAAAAVGHTVSALGNWGANRNKAGFKISSSSHSDPLGARPS